MQHCTLEQSNTWWFWVNLCAVLLVKVTYNLHRLWLSNEVLGSNPKEKIKECPHTSFVFFPISNKISGDFYPFKIQKFINSK
jgi:hypothetical protein